MRIFRKETTVSTNLDAREGSPGDVFVAEYQSAGRGRLNHEWLSIRGENLMFSVVLSGEDHSPAEIATLPLVVGLAIAKALSPFAALSLKWPNDVLCGGRKLAGILCERHGDNVIAGVGLNVNQTKFPQEIVSRATSLSLLSGSAFDRDELLSRLVASIFDHHAKWLQGGFVSLHDEFERFDCLKGRTLSVLQTDEDTTPVTGLCDGVAPDGSLIVGGCHVYAGEAHIIGG